jgi:ABC-2 type transport system ATP-binding protein
MSRPAVEFINVGKTYFRGLLRREAVFALQSVTLSVPHGTIFGLVGPNRAGKTTLIKMLLSICRPTHGEILRLGKPIADLRTLARVGYLHESPAFPRYLTAKSFLDYYGALTLLNKRELAARIPKLLDQVGLADRADEAISGFSKGMLQRLALAQALINEPELLVLDEPTEGMDLAARKLLHDVLRSRRTAGHTAILVSHSMADVEQLCDRVAVIREGRVAFQGPLGQLTKNHASKSQAGDRPDRSISYHTGEALTDALQPLYSGTELAGATS